MFKKLMILLTICLVSSLAYAADTPGFFDITRAAGCAWIEVSKPSSEGEVDREIKLTEGIAWELLCSENKVWVGDVILSELDGVIGGIGASVSVKEWAKSRNWAYQPEAEVFFGIDAGYRPDDKCFLAGIYGSIRF